MRALKYCLLAVVAAGAFLVGYDGGRRQGAVDAPLPAVTGKSDVFRFARRVYRLWKQGRYTEEQEFLGYLERLVGFDPDKR